MFFSNDKNEPAVRPFKFKQLRTFSSDEWMANSTKKYRKVFDRMETTYIRVEFSFYNKYFDEQDWSCTVWLKCFELMADGTKREICSLDTKRDVKMDENIVYMRDGWGNAKEGTFWKKGLFVWEAYINDELVGEEKFTVNDVGQVTNRVNPYFAVDYIKFYTGNDTGFETKDRKYLKTINRLATQYVWVEFKYVTKTNLDWEYELFFNFYDDAGQLKGQVTREGKIDAGKLDYRYTFDVGWGNDVAGSWKDERYSVEIVFMDTLIATAYFDVSTEEVEGVPDLILGTDQLVKVATEGSENTSTSTIAEIAKEETLEELMTKLDALTGLSGVKKGIREHIDYLQFIKLRKEKGFEESGKFGLHSVFTGNPGTGKTTVVNMLGKIYKQMGLLSKGHVKEVDRADLVGEYIGQTAPKTRKMIEEARGGILFVDEAYALARVGDDSKDFGKEVVEILLKEMSDGAGDIAIMVAGYPKEMDGFLDSNPGLKSRFAHYYHFDDYLPDELLAISLGAASKRGVTLTETAVRYLEEAFIESYRTRDRTFGNARLAIGLIDESKMNMGLRLMRAGNINELDSEALSRIEREDIERAFGGKERRRADLGINEKLLRGTLDQLNVLVGMDNIKTEVNELVKLVRFYRETGKDVLGKFSLHAVFTGNPGTGKTTVARIIADLYKALGLLEKGHLIEVDRQGLVAGYTGQTAIKTGERIEDAIGGVLFIDEAYALGEGGSSDFGKEAIEVILKRMEDLRGKFAVIVAGYPDNMFKFLETNPGLKSRFDRVFEFQDYTADELFTIAKYLLHLENLTPTQEAEAHLHKYLNQLYETRDKYFGNARSVRQVIGESVKNQNLRMASLTPAERTPDQINTLIFDDVAEFELKEGSSRASLGYRYGSK